MVRLLLVLLLRWLLTTIMVDLLLSSSRADSMMFGGSHIGWSNPVGVTCTALSWRKTWEAGGRCGLRGPFEVHSDRQQNTCNLNLKFYWFTAALKPIASFWPRENEKGTVALPPLRFCDRGIARGIARQDCWHDRTAETSDAGGTAEQATSNKHEGTSNPLALHSSNSKRSHGRPRYCSGL